MCAPVLVFACVWGVCARMYVPMCVCTGVCVQVFACTSVHLCVCVHMCVHMYRILLLPKSRSAQAGSVCTGNMKALEESHWREECVVATVALRRHLVSVHS